MKNYIIEFVERPDVIVTGVQRVFCDHGSVTFWNGALLLGYYRTEDIKQINVLKSGTEASPSRVVYDSNHGVTE